MRKRIEALLIALRSIESRASCAPNDDPDIANTEFRKIMLTARQAVKADSESVAAPYAAHNGIEGELCSEGQRPADK